jgi:hypothetical protein
LHPPQLLISLLMSTQPFELAQHIWPSGQAMVAVWHVPPSQTWFAPQQFPLQTTPLAQATQVPPTHVWPLEQVFPHLPQALTFVGPAHV